VNEGLGQLKLMMAPGGVEDEYPDRYNQLVDSYEQAMQADSYQEQAAEQGNLDQILQYNGPEETFEIVQSVSESMQEFETLFEEFRNQ
jgi:hypothetical protein